MYINNTNVLLGSIDEYPKSDRLKLTQKFLKEVYFEFRQVGLKWAKLTHQTNFFPKGYLGQNLVSIVVGIRGTGTAARGDDLIDGSEVKTCARVDQLNNCKDCKARIASYLNECPKCNGSNIKRMVDSHWICPVDDSNYKKYREGMPTIYFLLVDDDGLGNDYLVRFTIWRIEPRSNAIWQKSYIDDYYYRNYLPKKNQKRKPAPMNVHPKSPKFNSINPEIIFESKISNDGHVKILKFPD